MTTLVDIKRIAKEDLTPFLKERGFKMYKSMAYLRQLEDGISHRIFFTLNYGENLSVDYFCECPEMPYLPHRPFPQGSCGMVSGGLNKNWACEAGAPGACWKAGTPESAQQAMGEITTLIKDRLLPYFERMQTRLDLALEAPVYYSRSYWRPVFGDLMDEVNRIRGRDQSRP